MVICVKVFGSFLMFIKLSSYSNLIKHMFVISLIIIIYFTNKSGEWREKKISEAFIWDVRVHRVHGLWKSKLKLG